jgi:hypothetical protein
MGEEVAFPRKMTLRRAVPLEFVPMLEPISLQREIEFHKCLLRGKRCSGELHLLSFHHAGADFSAENIPLKRNRELKPDGRIFLNALY